MTHSGSYCEAGGYGLFVPVSVGIGALVATLCNTATCFYLRNVFHGEGIMCRDIDDMMLPDEHVDEYVYIIYYYFNHLSLLFLNPTLFCPTSETFFILTKAFYLLDHTFLAFNLCF